MARRTQPELQREPEPPAIDFPVATTGTIKSIFPLKGFGFVRSEDGQEWFFHRSATQDFQLLQVGQRVLFTPTRGVKGPRAEDVSLAEPVF